MLVVEKKFEKLINQATTTDQEVALAHLQALHEDAVLVDGEDAAAGGVGEHHVLPEHGPQVDGASWHLRRDAIDEHRDARCSAHSISITRLIYPIPILILF
jgi:hypothetical protein